MIFQLYESIFRYPSIEKCHFLVMLALDALGSEQCEDVSDEDDTPSFHFVLDTEPDGKAPVDSDEEGEQEDTKSEEVARDDTKVCCLV